MTAAVQRLSVQQVGALLARLDPAAQPVLLDVREPWELATASLQIDGAPLRHIPMVELPQRLDELDPAQTVLALCHHGMRSLQCVAFLARQGFADVYNIDGGIDAWSCLVDPSVPRY